MPVRARALLLLLAGMDDDGKLFLKIKNNG